MIRRIERQGAMHDATDGVKTRTVVEKGTDNLLFGVEPTEEVKTVRPLGHLLLSAKISTENSGTIKR